MFKKLFGKKDENIQAVETPEALPMVHAEKKSWVSRLRSGLSESSSKLTQGLTQIFTHRTLDDEALEELEELLITADLGVKTASYITESIARNRYNKEITPDEIKQALAEEVANVLEPVARPIKPLSLKPQVILVTGVNGNGKTTTIGKMARQLQLQGKKVMMAACDTFRAAAVEQLVVWAERNGCPIITGKHEADPASVAYTALEAAREQGVDVLLIDTAGRLHNKQNLMEELAKIVRVLQKLDADVPHNTLLVLDASTGQNAFHQLRVFKEMVNISGLIVTKLDGTAKGGVIVGLAKEFGLPIHAIGVGEGIDDLQPFNAQEFAENLVGIAQ